MEVQRQSKQLNENKESRNKQLLIYQRKFVVVRALGLKVTMAFIVKSTLKAAMKYWPISRLMRERERGKPHCFSQMTSDS